MSRKKPPHYSKAKPANGTLNAASKMKKKKKNGKTMAEKAKTNKLHIGKELETCIIPTASVAKKQESKSPATTTTGVQNAASKKKDESTAHKAKNKQYHSKELETCTIPPTGVAKKRETTLPSKATNGAQHAASKKKDESTAHKAKNKQYHSKELEACEKRESNAPAKSPANGTKKPASKKKNKKGDAIKTETFIIPTTGVARKRKSPPRAANGAKLESAMPAKKRRPGAVSDSGSNSEAEDYIDRFFVDVDDPDDVANGGGGGGGASEDSGDEDDDYDTDTDDGDSEDDEDGEALPFETLLDYYGKRRDVKDKQKQSKGTAAQQTLVAYKPIMVRMAGTSGWIVEDNDRDLSNAASDEVVAKASKNNTEALAVANKSRVYGSAAVDDSTEEESLEVEDGEEVEWSDDDCSDEFSGWDDTDQELDSNSEMWTDTSEETYQQSWDTNSDGSEDSGLTYLRQPYDSDSYDEDYSPSGSDWEQEDVLYIPPGNDIFDLNDDSIQFDGEGPQIFELPIDYDTDGKQLTTDAPSDTDAQSDTSIPALVPIYNEYDEFIDCPEKIRKKPEPTESVNKSATVIGGVEAEQVVPTQEAMATDVNETEGKADGVKENGIGPADPSTMADEENVDGEEIQQASRYRFYDAVEGRMALGVLRQDVYFYGYVSVQALYGRVEMLGYRLETGETRTVNAARGYNAVNLVALPSTEPFDRATFAKTLEKLKPNFVDADISELVELFDPKESVLVLLRSDPAEAGLLPIICNFLEEYNLFPTVNTLTGKSPFRRTEFLLEVEFFTSAVAPARSIPVFQNDPAWDDVQLQDSSRLLVVGGKGAGKSTLCQFMVNRFIRQFGRILLVDLDIGQPVLHLPETVSASVLLDPVLGVGCFAKVQSLRSLLFGSLNVVSSPLRYLQNVRTLVQHCEADPDLKGVPWIVNTMGYVGGFGEELMAAIIRLVQPTELIQLTIPKHMKGAQNYENSQTDGHVNGFKFNILQEEMGQLSPQQQQPLAYRFHPWIVSFDQRGCPLHPPKRRTLSIMSQLVQILGDSNEWFTDIKPFSAPLDELQILNTRDEYALSKEIMPNILSAMMVYLCERLDNDQYNCLGVGIVRAVDKNNNVHLLHYLPPDQLAKVKVLALCSTNLPSQIHLRLNSKMDGTIPYLQNVG